MGERGGIGGRVPRAVLGPAAGAGADAGLGDGGHDRVESEDRAGLNEGGGAGAQHRRDRQLRGEDLFGRGLALVQRDDPAAEFLLERQVLGDDAADQRLGDVDMAVDKSGGNEEAAAIDGFARGGRDLGAGADGDDAVAGDGDGAIGQNPPLRIHGDDHRAGDQGIDVHVLAPLFGL